MNPLYPGSGTDPLLDLLASERLIAYRPSFARLTGSVTTAVLLSQFLYWTYTETVQARGGWFWKTMPEIEEETGLSRREQDSARKRLRDLGILEEDERGVPMKIWFRVDREQLFAALRAEFSHLGGKRQDNLADPANLTWQDAPGKVGEKRPPISETTTNITPREKTLNVPRGRIHMAPGPVQEVVMLTGDTKSLKRFEQLYEIARESGWSVCWDEAERSLRNRMDHDSLGPLEKPGAYFSATLVSLLQEHGVYVPTGSAEERSQVRGDITRSLGLEEAA